MKRLYDERENMEQMKIQEKIEEKKKKYTTINCDQRTDMIAWLIRNPEASGNSKVSSADLCKMMSESTKVIMQPAAFQKYRYRIYPDSKIIKYRTPRKSKVNGNGNLEAYVKELQLSCNLLAKRVHRIESELGLDKL